MSLYICLLYNIYQLCFTFIDFYKLSAWDGCWFVYIRRFIYKFLNVCPFDYTAVAGSGTVGPVDQVNHTSLVAVFTPTHRPKSVRNRCVIKLFCGVACVVTLQFWHFCWCRGFCHRTESDLFLFLFMELRVVSKQHLQLVWHASKEHVPFRTPASVTPLGTYLCSNGWDTLSRACRIFTG